MNWQAAVERTVSGLGYDLVDLERSGGGLLRVTIDNPAARGPVTVDDCEAVTRQLQYLLEVEDVDYARLEVSSPGLDRPLKKPADYERFAGELIDLTLKLPFQGRKKYRGRLQARDGGWRLLLDDGTAKPLSKTKAKAAAKAAAKGEAASADETVQQALDFVFDEVREARLVPMVDFKGRAAEGARADDTTANATPGDGGQEE